MKRHQKKKRDKQNKNKKLQQQKQKLQRNKKEILHIVRTKKVFLQKEALLNGLRFRY